MMKQLDRRPGAEWGPGESSAPGESGEADDPLPPLAALIAELGELKRVRCAGRAGSAAERLFRAAWGRLCAGEPVGQVAGSIVVAAIVGCELGAIDDDVLREVGVAPDRRRAILHTAFAAATARIPGHLTGWLWPGAGAAGPMATPPAFVDALAAQPRAGATAPGHPRLVLEPAESHADHCVTVAVAGVLLAGREGADPSRVFLAGLAHHLHNARLPDSGFAGELLLGESLAPIMRGLFDREIATLPEALGAAVRGALEVIVDADTPEGRAFHIADVFDRVLQVRYHDRVARFRAEQALGDMDLVHAGPLQSFHKAMLRQAGLL